MSATPTQNDELKILLIRMLKHVEKMKEDNSSLALRVSELEQRFSLIESHNNRVNINVHQSSSSARTEPSMKSRETTDGGADNKRRFCEFIEIDELKAYLGSKYDWYARKWLETWEKVQNKAKPGITYESAFAKVCGTPSFNPGSVLFFVPWLYYRKMLSYALALTALFAAPEIIQLATGNAYFDKVTIYISIGTIIAGVFGNGTYLRHARRQVDSAKQTISDKVARADHLRARGRCSVVACIAGLLCLATPNILMEVMEHVGGGLSISSQSSAEVALAKIDSITQASPKRDVAQAMITCGGMWANAPIGQQMSLLFTDRNAIIAKFGVTSRQIDSWYAEGRELQSRIQSAQIATQNEAPDRQLKVGMLALASGMKCMKIVPIFGNVLLGK